MAPTFVMIADIPSGAEALFQRYESLVLPLLAQYGGHLERRLRTCDTFTEVHIVSFDSQAGYDAYIADEERQSHRQILEGIDITQRVLQVKDVDPARMPPPVDAQGARAEHPLR